MKGWNPANNKQTNQPMKKKHPSILPFPISSMHWPGICSELSCNPILAGTSSGDKKKKLNKTNQKTPKE